MRAPGSESRFLSWGMANMHLTAIVEQEGTGFVALCPELDVASQGSSVEEATENLKEAVELFLSTADGSEIASRLENRIFVTHFEAHVGAA
jgi:predicted RNase H-like HicB family nuclease